MSDLSVPTTAEVLAADLGLPFTVLPSTPSLVGSTRPGTRRA
jgi:hypothetical protein